jgi:GT2 family glycosyltransferase
MIALVTVTYNSEPVLEDFLACARTLPERPLLIAVDNASSDGSLGMLRAADDLDLEVLPQPTNRGIAVGNNVGIRRALEAGAEWIVLINNDTTFQPDLLTRLLAAARSASAEIVVPSIRYFDEPDVVWFEAARFATWRGSVPVSLPPAPAGLVRPIECACTCCALVHRSVFDRVGTMDETYFVYWDDTDFFLRCHRADIPMVLDAGTTMLHKVSALTGGGESEFSQRERIKNRAYFVRKHHRAPVRQIALVLTAVNALRLAVGSAARRQRARVLIDAFRAGVRLPV